MKRLALLMLCGVGTAAHYALAQDSTAADILRAGCADDVQRFCANVAPGGGRIIACLREHRDVVSDQCKQAAAKVAAMSGNPGSNPTPNPAPGTAGGFPNSAAASPDLGAAPSAPAPPAANPSATKSSASSSRRSSSSSTAPGSYVVLKKVQITDPGAANMYASMPAVDLLIPPNWGLNGGVTFGGGKGGCFSDLMAVSWKATSPDGSAFWGLPNYSWQYTNDPTEMRNMNDPRRRQTSVGGKPCPVAQPMKAEDYFRQNVVPQLLSHTVVSVEPYPDDHAWLNGSNEYVMSDDPNFNPNSQLSGSWNELQVVRPSP